MSWQLPTVISEVGDVEGALAQAYQTYKDTEQVDHGAHVHSAIEAAISFAKDLVSSGIFGSHKVQATVGGHANPGFESVPNQTAPDQVSVHIQAVPPEPEPAQTVPGTQQAPPMSTPHQDTVPPPGPLGASVTPTRSYDPNAGKAGKASKAGEDEEDRA